MISPTKDLEGVYYLLNHPSIKDWVFGDYVIDTIKPLIDDEENKFFLGDLGGCFFIKRAPDIYELHSFVLPAGRGRWARDNFMEVLGWMFANTPATRIVTMCPVNNRMAIGAARMCGFKKYDKVPEGWKQNGHSYDIDMYYLRKEA